MTTGTIQRNRPKNEMVLVFWDNLNYPTYLLLSLLMEKTTCIDEGATNDEWYNHVCRAIRHLKIYNYGQVKREIQKLARIEKVDLLNR